MDRRAASAHPLGGSVNGKWLKAFVYTRAGVLSLLSRGTPQSAWVQTHAPRIARRPSWINNKYPSDMPITGHGEPTKGHPTVRLSVGCAGAVGRRGRRAGARVCLKGVRVACVTGARAWR